MAVFEELGNLLFPPRCLGCGQVLPLGEDCCENCQKIYCHLPPPGDWAGRPVSSAWLYWEQYPVAIRRLKFRRDRRDGRRIARLMAGQWRRQFPGFGEDLLTFMPMPPDRERRRGGNQAELLARWIGEELGCSVVPLLSREGILTQHQLPAAARQRQKQDSFRLLPGAEGKILGRRVILVDDLITTGATAGACLRLLEGAGAERTAILVAARAG